MSDTDWTADVRLVTEYVGWDWVEEGEWAPCAETSDGAWTVNPAVLNDSDWDHFAAAVLDKLEAQGVAYAIAADGSPSTARLCAVVGQNLVGGPWMGTDAMRAKAIIRATAAYRRSKR